MTTTTDQAPAISAAGLRKSFRTPGGRVVAVDGLDLEIHRGEIVAFLGPNGAGKTTSIDMILGLTTPEAGTVRVLGAPPRQAVAAGRVGAVLQTGGLLRDLTVRETVVAIASLHRTGHRVDEVMHRTRTAELSRRKVSRCSGGEQQRLKFALALLPDPDVLILDEPTAGMDVVARRDFWDNMHEEAAAGRTVVFATHYLEEAERFAQRTVLVAHGRVVADGPTAVIRGMAAGQRVRATMPPLSDAAAAALSDAVAAVDGVREVRLEGVTLNVVTTAPDPLALMLLRDHGARDLVITAPSLDEVFADLTRGEPSTAAGRRRN